MQRSVGRALGWSMAFFALASCSEGTPGTQTGLGGAGGSAGTGQAGSNQPTGGTAGTTAGTSGAGTAGTGGAGGSPAGTGGAPPTGGTTGTAGSGGGAGGAAGTGGGAGGAAGATGGAGGAAGTTGGMGGQRTDASAPDAGGDAATDGGGEWISLFNGRDLTGWTASQGHAALFAAGMLNGEPVIHVYPTQADQSNQPEATLRTTQSFSRYVFQLDYKWGTKRYGGRSQSERDNGICFHICNNPAQVWPESIEFQLGEQNLPGDWVSGHIFMLINRTRAQWTYTMQNNQRVYSPTGTRMMIGAPTSYHKAMTDRRRDRATEWNTVELTVLGSSEATYVVNGEVANRLTDMECQENGTWRPLTSGPIALQAEYAELYFRNIRIRMLP